MYFDDEIVKTKHRAQVSVNCLMACLRGGLKFYSLSDGKELKSVGDIMMSIVANRRVQIELPIAVANATGAKIIG